MDTPLTTESDNLAERIAGRRGWVLLGLLLLAMLPRAIAAWRLDAFCYDAYYYLYVADFLQRGNPVPLLAAFDLNIYPVILAALHSAGLAWMTAAKLWGVLVCTLLVLPLYGVTRRMFGDKIALIVCGLYAVHPEMIEYAAEPIRDPTYWFLMTLYLYAILRAWREQSWPWFIAAGFVFALAAHTRLEGWFLLAIPAWWFVRDWRERVPGRVKLLFGSSASLAITPALILLVNVTLLSDQPQPHYGRIIHHLSQLETDTATQQSAARRPLVQFPLATMQFHGTAAAAFDRDEATAHPSSCDRAVHYVNGFLETCGYFNAILLLFGCIYCYRRRVSQRDVIGIYVTCCITAIAVWMFYSQHGVTNDRYFLSNILLMMPLQALGFLQAIDWLQSFRESRGRATNRTAAIGWVFAILATICLIDTFTGRHKRREDDIALANWIANQPGGSSSLFVDRAAMRIGFHTRSEMPPVLKGHDHLMRRFGEQPPEWIIVSRSRCDLRTSSVPLFTHDARQLGWDPVDISQFRYASRQHYVFRRTRPQAAAAEMERRRR